ncbi:MAG TPA: hypothetical protein VF076_09460 [Acidimicrobiales bacterium]
MAESTLPAPRPQAPVRRRAFFGLFDADGWGWASVKAIFWFVVMIMLLGYLPDRAYYFTVQKTVDLGLLLWSPINFCPPENLTLPCPAPAGATLPWQPSPTEIQLPGGRTDGAAGLVGQVYIYAGGSDGLAPKADVYFTRGIGNGNLDVWKAAPPLPEARASAGSVVIGNTMYVIGGFGPDGKPTDTVYSMTLANDGTFGEWTTVTGAQLPVALAGLSAAAVSDGIVIMGGTDGTAPGTGVWKTQMTNTTPAVPGPWVAQNPLVEPNIDGVAMHVGDYVFLIGGSNATSPVASVQVGTLGGPDAVPANPNAMYQPWKVSAQTNLPSPRTNLSGFTSNGVMYIQGGSDGSSPLASTLWTTPDADGVIPLWQTLSQTDLGQGIQGAAAVPSGSYAFIFGGQTASGLTGGAARTYLAPQPPFFQLGLLGATVPGLKLDGEIGQQIGYLNAATVGAVNFILLILVGWGFAHKERVQEIIAARRRRRKG